MNVVRVMPAAEMSMIMFVTVVQAAHGAVAMAMGRGITASEGNDLAVRAVGMVVVVLIDGQGLDRPRSEQSAVLWIGGHGLRRAGATHVAVQAQDTVGFRHDEMQVVGDEQDSAAQFVADVADQFIERDLAREVDALHRFVQDQKVGTAQDRARHQGALKLAAGPVMVIRRRTVKGRVSSMERR